MPDAWIDHETSKVGYEIPFNRHFYIFEPPRALEEINADLKQVTGRILKMIEGLAAAYRLQQVNPPTALEGHFITNAFTRDASFENTTFTGNAHFGNATFSGHTSFATADTLSVYLSQKAA